MGGVNRSTGPFFSMNEVDAMKSNSYLVKLRRKTMDQIRANRRKDSNINILFKYVGGMRNWSRNSEYNFYEIKNLSTF